MTGRLTLVVLLQVHSEHGDDYDRFETAASDIMLRHGGRIEHRIDLRSHAQGPDEVHIVTFPSEESFDAYLQDPELATLKALRARAIRETVVWRGKDLLALTPEEQE